eukprot:CAMPEP_0182618854 /NCGR_PEP_ID=MMETSP1330-20130603/45806_1 /TAXON_ID=464278 /ORGANISM="Picochlorum sp., Strain RCC944" /LENGTH=252 /DNA_ID=CAMNT_0024839087 /DNA_START=286 /DNA_END=1042 /DNA_ORIENTATION=-
MAKSKASRSLAALSHIVLVAIVPGIRTTSRSSSACGKTSYHSACRACESWYGEVLQCGKGTTREVRATSESEEEAPANAQALAQALAQARHERPKKNSSTRTPDGVVAEAKSSPDRPRGFPGALPAHAAMNIFMRRWPQSQGETAAADGKTRAQPFPFQRLARAPANHAGARPADQVAGQTNEFLHLIRGTPRPPTARSVESRPKGILPQALSGAVCATSTRLRDSKRAKASRSLAALSHIVLVAIVTKKSG